MYRIISQCHHSSKNLFLGVMPLRYLVHKSQSQEIPGRQEYLYDIFHLFFLPREEEKNYIPLIPVGHVDLNILFIGGHANQVFSYINQYIDEIPEEVIMATTCFPQNLRRYKRKKTIFVPKITSDFCYVHSGAPYGFSFDITDAELDFYNASGNISERINSAYTKL